MVNTENLKRPEQLNIGDTIPGWGADRVVAHGKPGVAAVLAEWIVTFTDGTVASYPPGSVVEIL